MTRPPSRCDVTITVDRDRYHLLNRAEFAVGAQQAASARAASVVSAHTAGQIISMVTVHASDRPAAVAIALAVIVRGAQMSGRVSYPLNASARDSPATGSYEAFCEVGILVFSYSQYMPTSDAVPVIIGAAIGAGGAVIAQVVSSLFTSKRERGQLDWERKRQEHEWEMRKEERFLSLKQEAYSNIALMANTFLTYIYYAIDYADSEPDEPRPAVPNLQEMLRLRSNIEIVAPKEVSDPVRTAVVKLIEAKDVSDSSHLSRERIGKEADEAESKWREAYRAMRADLHGGGGTL